MKKLMKNIIGGVSLNVLLVSILFVISLFVFGFIAHEIVSENETSFDNSVFDFFKAHTTKNLVAIMSFLTFFGSSYFFIASGLPCHY